MRSISAILLILLAACSSSEVAQFVAPQAPQAKVLALTYDDAPLGDGPRFTGPERTEAMLQQFTAAATGPVAIFVTTKGFDQEEGVARIRKYAAAGHRIANHSDQHLWASRTNTEDYIADIDTAEAKLAGFENRRPWFRFPYLDEGGQGEANRDAVKRDALREALAERGLVSGYVTIDTYDWYLDQLWRNAVRDGLEVDTGALSDIYVAMVLDAARHYDALAQEVLGRRPAQVLLLHENDLAASFTADMVAALRADGWTIIDPDDAFSDPVAEQIPQTLFSGMGRISALATDAGTHDWAALSHWSVNEQAIDEKLETAQVFTAPDNPSSIP